MTDSTPPASPAQEAAEQTPQAGTSQPVQEAAAPRSITELPEWAQKELRDLRKESAAGRTAEKSVTQQRDELLTKFNDVAGQLRDYRARDLLRDAGAIHPDLLTSRLSDDALSGDEKLQAKEIDALKKAYPGLFKVGSADGANGRAAPAATPGSSLNDAIRRKLGG
jgi:hypothetical protein